MYLNDLLRPAKPQSPQSVYIHSVHLISEHGKHFHNFHDIKLFFCLIHLQWICLLATAVSPDSLLSWSGVLAPGQLSLNFKETKVLLTALRRHQEELLPLEAEGEELEKVSCLSSQAPTWVRTVNSTTLARKAQQRLCLPQNPEEDRALYRVTAVLPSLLSREHSDLLHNGPVGKLFCSQQSSSPESYQYRKEKY